MLSKNFVKKIRQKNSSKKFVKKIHQKLCQKYSSNKFVKNICQKKKMDNIFVKKIVLRLSNKRYLYAVLIYLQRGSCTANSRECKRKNKDK